MTQHIQRKATLLFDHYENVSVIAKDNQPIHPVEKINYQNLSIDDLDMVSLSTTFDNQMILGSPMYMEHESNPHDCLPEHYRSEQFYEHTSYPKGKSLPLIAEKKKTQEKSFVEVAKNLRKRYIKSSYQDSKSNLKNNIDEWFLYPKPLPKFWRYTKDRRFSAPDPELSDTEETAYAAEQGYYLPLNDDKNVYASTAPISKSGDAIKPKTFGSYPYTGEFFDINDYKKEFESHVTKHVSTNLNWSDDDIPDFKTFTKDLEYIIKASQIREYNVMAEKRLDYLLDKFDLFQHLKSNTEILENKKVPYRDFYNSRKVDRDLLLSGCIQQRQLSEFIWEKLNEEPERIVHKTLNGESISLLDIFRFGSNEDEFYEGIGLKAIDDEFVEWYKTIYLLNLHLQPTEDAEMYFNGKHMKFYLLAKTFLEYDNYMNGEYFAELFIRHVIYELEKNKYLLAQISVDFCFYRSDNVNFWTKFSDWILRWNLVSYNIRWNIRISRGYTKLFNTGLVQNFQNYLDLIFNPLLDESNTENINLSFFLSNVCSFDLLVEDSDDYIWKEFTESTTTPCHWIAQGDNPPIAYYMYYIYKAVSKINCLRHARHQNCFTLRNGCSSLKNRTSQFGTDLYYSDSAEALVCNLLLCNGGLLQSQPVWVSAALLQYLYYLFQIPLIASPLSSVSYTPHQTKKLLSEYEEESLTIHHETRDVTYNERSVYAKNPFMKMFHLGMKLSLSCKSLLFNNSYTHEPIMEEYSVAASIYLLNAADLCELTRNSVLCSSFEGWYKRHWIGVTITPSKFAHELVGLDDWYDISEAAGEKGTSMRHNVPPTRINYRNGTFAQEWKFADEEFY